MYTTQRLRVKWGDKVSNDFNCRNGVKQGGVLSPILFCLYMDELLKCLSRSGVGCYMVNTFCGALCYADDLALLCPTRSYMNKLLKICGEFASEYGLKFNSTKSVFMSFNVDVDVSFELNSSPNPIANSALHLGHTIGGCSNYNNISSATSSFIASVNTMLSRFGFCSSYINSLLVNSYCTSYYGSILWKMDSSDIQRLFISWRKVVRRIWKLPYRTHCNLLPVIMNSHNIQVQIMLRFLKCMFNIQCSANVIVNACYKHSVFSNAAIATNRRFVMQYQ